MRLKTLAELDAAEKPNKWLTMGVTPDFLQAELTTAELAIHEKQKRLHPRERVHRRNLADKLEEIAAAFPHSFTTVELYEYFGSTPGFWSQILWEMRDAAPGIMTFVSKHGSDTTYTKGRRWMLVDNWREMKGQLKSRSAKTTQRKGNKS